MPSQSTELNTEKRISLLIIVNSFVAVVVTSTSFAVIHRGIRNVCPCRSTFSARRMIRLWPVPRATYWNFLRAVDGLTKRKCYIYNHLWQVYCTKLENLYMNII